MKITIHYCGRWNYLPRATSLAARIKQQTGIEPELVRGDSGIFDVLQDERRVFSKHEAGRFPEEDEVLDLLGWRPSMIGEGREDDEAGESGKSREADEVPFVDLCATTDIPDGGVVAFRAQGRDFLLCRAGSSFYAISDRCTHAAWNLAGSEVRGCEIVCSLHGARFDLRTGAAVSAPASKPIGTFPVRTRGARIEVQVTAPPR